MCHDISRYLVEQGVFLAGVDLIDGYLTEINVTSPTLLREIKYTGGPDVAKMFWDRVRTKISNVWPIGVSVGYSGGLGC